MKKKQGRRVRIVTEELGDGAIREHNDQAHVKEVIFSNIQDQICILLG